MKSYRNIHLARCDISNFGRDSKLINCRTNKSVAIITVCLIATQSSISENRSDPTQFAHNNDSLENLILDEAEQCYNRIVEAYVDKCTI